MLILLQCGDRSLVLDVANFYDLRSQAEALFQPLIDVENELDLCYEFPTALAAEKGLAIPSNSVALLGSPSRYLTNNTLALSASIARGGADATGTTGFLSSHSATSPIGLNVSGRVGELGQPQGNFTAFVRCPQSFNTFLGVWQECIQPTLVSSEKQLLPTLEVTQGPRMAIPTLSSSPVSAKEVFLSSHNRYSNADSRGGLYVGPSSPPRGSQPPFEGEGGSSPPSPATRNKSARPTDRRNDGLHTPLSTTARLTAPYADYAYAEDEALRVHNKAVIAAVLSPSKLASLATTPGSTNYRARAPLQAAPTINTYYDRNEPSPARDNHSNFVGNGAMPAQRIRAPSVQEPNQPPQPRQQQQQQQRNKSARTAANNNNSYDYDENGMNGMPPQVYVPSQPDDVGPDGLTANQRTAKALLASFAPASRSNTTAIRAVMRCGEASVLIPFDPRRPPTQQQLLNGVREAMLRKLRDTEADLSSRSPTRARSGGQYSQDELLELAALEALNVPDPSAVVFLLGMTLPGAEQSMIDVDDDRDVKLLADAMIASGNDYDCQLVVESREADDTEALAMPNAFFFGEVVHHPALGFNRTEATPSRSASRNVSRPVSRAAYDDDED